MIFTSGAALGTPAAYESARPLDGRPAASGGVPRSGLLLARVGVCSCALRAFARVPAVTALFAAAVSACSRLAGDVAPSTRALGCSCSTISRCGYRSSTAATTTVREAASAPQRSTLHLLRGLTRALEAPGCASAACGKDKVTMSRHAEHADRCSSTCLRSLPASACSANAVSRSASGCAAGSGCASPRLMILGSSAILLLESTPHIGARILRIRSTDPGSCRLVLP